MISNTFTINSAGISPATRQREQQTRGVQRRLNIAPQIVNFDIKCDSPGKENMSEEDISFYASNDCSLASPRHCAALSPCRNDDEECLSPGTSPSIFTIDNNAMHAHSQDSKSIESVFNEGLQTDISNSSISKTSTSSSTTSAFTFVKPKCPESFNSSPLSQNRTPSKFTLTSSGSSRMGNNFRVYNSLSSGSNESMDPDDEYMQLMEMETMDDEEAQMPNDLNSLFCKTIMNSRTPDPKRPSIARKCLNLDGSMNSPRGLFSSPLTPKSSSTITSLITTPERQCLTTLSENITQFAHRSSNTGGFKRPVDPPTKMDSMSPLQIKRIKCENEIALPSPPLVTFKPSPFTQKRPILRKSVSMNDAAVIMSALSRSSSEPNLIGDFSRQYSLPIVEGRHSDLKSISSDTLRSLLLGEFDDTIASFKIIDCRYPYEYEGGHIRGAINLYSQEHILEELVNHKTDPPIVATEEHKRHILIFHCEFSSERGPKL